MNIPDIKFKYSNISEQGIEIIELDKLYTRKTKMDHNPNQPHRVHFNLIIYIEQGKGTHFIDFKHYPFMEGDLIFINQNQIHAFPLNNKIKGKAVLFTKICIENIQTNINMSGFLLNDICHYPVLTPSSPLAKSCTSLFTEINKEMKYKDKNSLTVILLFSSMLVMLERERKKTYANKLNNNQVKQFNNFVTLLGETITEKRDAYYHAKQLHISYKTLNNLCKLATNKTAKQSIDSYTIIEIKRYLILEDKQIQEIAYNFGFIEVSNFVKYFKKHTTLTPFQFKKQTIS
jgi:hypothetical protein